MTGNLSCKLDKRIEWVDTDASGHQHNSVIMRLVESCEAEMFRTLGLTGPYFPAAPRVRQEINYTGLLHFGQLTTTTLTVAKVGTASLEFSFEVFADAHQDMQGNPVPAGQVAHGSMVVVHLEPGASSTTPWPKNIRTALSQEKTINA